MLILTIAIKDQVELRLSLVCGTLGALNSEATILYYTQKLLSLHFEAKIILLARFLVKGVLKDFLIADCLPTLSLIQCASA